MKFLLNNNEIFIEYKYIQLNIVECKNIFCILTLSIGISLVYHLYTEKYFKF